MDTDQEIASLSAERASDSEGRVAERLLAAGKLNKEGFTRALRVAKASHQSLVEVLTKMGLVSERDMAAALSEALGLRLAGKAEFPVSPLYDDRVSLRFLRDAKALPLDEEAGVLRVAMANPLDAFALQSLGVITGKEIRPCVGVPAEIEQGIEQLYASGGAESAQESDTDVDLSGKVETDVERLRDLASEAPVIRIVNQVISRAVEMRASDVHIEPFENSLRLRYRVDGLLREMDPLPLRHGPAIASRVKIMAHLNIAEQRLPQDGRVKLTVRGNPVDLRVSTVPTLYGESLVLRILDREGISFEFEKLGFVEHNLDSYLDALEQSHGVFLVTGPTGSGKTTTLYASLLRLNSPEKKIITVEDPVEYQLAGVNQIQVKPKIGLDFANVLRSILRQDPDIILIGEIRDLETAQIAVQAALTGHLVLSTLHTNNAAGTITRLMDMGVEDYLLTATLNGVAAQRLVRTLCTACRVAYRPDDGLTRTLGLDRFLDEGAEPTLYRAKGCDTCNGMGYRGRTSIIETLNMSAGIREKILAHADGREIQRAAVKQGMRTMYDDGLAKALKGLTSVEEVLRVTREV